MKVDKKSGKRHGGYPISRNTHSVKSKYLSNSNSIELISLNKLNTLTFQELIQDFLF